MFDQLQPIISKRYVLQEKLGQGGMGSVYRALDRLSGREIALKRVTTDRETLHLGDSTDTQDFRLALTREFKLSASLRHPNIVQVLDYGFDDEQQPFFTMELLKAPQNLVDASQGQPFDVRMGYVVQVCYALTYLHRRGIVHHDLKPANVLVVDSQVKVLDFGLSIMHERTLHDANESNMTAGTLAYMAPEVLMGEAGGIPSDLYAVGMMAFEIFANHHPFDVDQPGKLINQIVSEVPQISEMDIPLDIAMVISRLLSKDPHSRYQSATAVIEALNYGLTKSYAVESAAIRESFLQAARLVGRDAELNQLVHALNAMTEKKGSMWLIAGESGVGKSRIVDELRTVAMVKGAIVMRGQAVNVGSRPFEMWLPVMRWLCLLEEDLADADIALLKNFIPDIETLLGGRNVDHIEAQKFKPKVLRERLLNLIERVFRRQNKPIVILFDDLHWMGSESLVTLAEISSWIQDLAVMIVGTYRDEERPQLAQELPKIPVMKLKRLDNTSMEELSAAMLGEAGRSPQVVDLLRRESEGNVFFAIEVVRVLAEEVGNLENIGRTTLPPRVFAGGIKTVIQRRLNQLDDQSRYLLNVAAVMGRQLNLRVLRRIAPEMQVQVWLSNCANAAILEVEEDAWRFTHDKLREALIENLVQTERVIIHSRIATAMEYYYTDNSAYAMALAYHWGNANDRAKEERFVTLAGEMYLRMGGYYEAMQAFQRAEALAVQLELPHNRVMTKLVNLRQLMGSAQMGLGQYEAARSLYSDSLQLMQELQDRQGIATALGHLGSVAFVLEDFEDARAKFTQSLTIYRELNFGDGIAQTLNSLGDVLYEMGDHDGAKVHYQESLDLARQSGMEWGMAGSVRQTQLVSQLSMSDSEHDKAKEIFLEMLTIHRQTNNARGVADTLYNLGVATAERQDWQVSKDYFEQALHDYGALNDDLGVAQTNERIATLAVDQGDTETAMTHYRHALEASRRSGQIALSLKILIGIAKLFIQDDQGYRALEILGFILHDSQTPEHLQDLVETIIFEIEGSLSASIIEAAWEASKLYNLDSLINDLL